MNLLAHEIGIEQEYQNSSGLPTNPNFSSGRAVAILAAIALRNELFYEIVNQKDYELKIKN
jgi:D-alanyl-D-alanine carboxypeptidase